ncbi:hypothetical protein KAU32_07130 [bacterium]|nr:hypothetical protein [bacterium]
MDKKLKDTTEDILNKFREIIPGAFKKNISKEIFQGIIPFDVERFITGILFKIKTPIGNYNTDWALLKKNEKTVYFVAETKFSGQELRESDKIGKGNNP